MRQSPEMPLSIRKDERLMPDDFFINLLENIEDAEIPASDQPEPDTSPCQHEDCCPDYPNDPF